MSKYGPQTLRGKLNVAMDYVEKIGGIDEANRVLNIVKQIQEIDKPPCPATTVICSTCNTKYDRFRTQCPFCEVHKP